MTKFTNRDDQSNVSSERKGIFYEDIAKAPFYIGQWVQYIGPTDQTIDAYGVGRVGQVYAFANNLQCGESLPDDPVIYVSELPHDWHWKEELRALSTEELSQITEIYVEVPVEVLGYQDEFLIKRHFVLRSGS